MANDPPFSKSCRIAPNRFYSGFAISRAGFRLPYLFVCIETRLISISSFRRGSTCFLWGSKAMSTSNCTLSSPPPRPRPEGRAQTRSSGAADSPCVLCSPPARPAGDGLDLRSPLDGRVAAEDPIALIVESWCSPTLVSPAGRPCSVMQLGQQQAAGPVEIIDPYLEDEQWDITPDCLLGRAADEHSGSRGRPPFW